MNAPTELPAHIRAVVVKPIGTAAPLRVHGTFYDAATGTLTIGVAIPDAPSFTADQLFAELERKAHIATERRIAELRGKMDAADRLING